MKPSTTPLLASVFVAVCALTACSDDGATTTTSADMTMAGTTPAPGAAAAAAPNEIVIAGFAFSVPATVSPGDRITVRNDDAAEHTVTADAAGAFDVEIEGGGTATLTVPSTPGTYPFHCTYHPAMHAALVVG
ncbi:copper-binding protein [Rhodococcus sp. WS4]|nr:copper-binding protein [Rhodococcus sp. WS4]